MERSRPDPALGPYRLVETLGEGGMGIVYLAISPQGGLVAVKTLRPWLIGGQDGRARFARELATLRLVRGPRVAEVIDADIRADPPYIVTRYVRGPALSKVVGDHGPLRAVPLERFALGLADAVAEVHAVGLVHRDVKPGNVLLADGGPVLIDFGLALATDGARLTATGFVAGTPGYLAPETVLAQPATAATDVHGWAATVAYAATGQAPYGTGPDAVVLDRIRRGEHDASGLHALPDRWRDVVLRALRVDPAQRPGLDEVRAVLRGDDPVGVAGTAGAPTEVRPVAGGPQPGAVPGSASAPTEVRAAATDAPTEVRGAATGAPTEVRGAATGAPTEVRGAATGAPTEVRPSAWTSSGPGRSTDSDAPTELRPAGGGVGADAPTEVGRPAASTGFPASPRVPTGPPAASSARADLWARIPARHQERLRRLPTRAAPVVVAALVVAVFALAPYAGAVLVLLLVLLLRAVVRTRRRLVRRRSTRGPGRSDRWWVAATSPWDVVVSAPVAVLVTGLAVVCGGLVGSLVALVDVGGFRAPQAAVGVVCVALLWWGPAAPGVRTGVRLLQEPLWPNERAAWVVVAVGVVLLLIVLLVGESYGVSWAPASSPPWAGLLSSP